MGANEYVSISQTNWIVHILNMETHNDCSPSATDPDRVDVPIWILTVGMGGAFVTEDDLTVAYLETPTLLTIDITFIVN